MRKSIDGANKNKKKYTYKKNVIRTPRHQTYSVGADQHGRIGPLVLVFGRIMNDALLGQIRCLCEIQKKTKINIISLELTFRALNTKRE